MENKLQGSQSPVHDARALYLMAAVPDETTASKSLDMVMMCLVIIVFQATVAILRNAKPFSPQH